VTLTPKNWPGWLRKTLTMGGSAGIGATIALSLIDKEHHLIVETFRGWGASSLLGLVALFLFSQASSRVMDMGDKMIEVARQSAASQQQLADAVNAIARKDDQESYEQRVLMGHIGTQTEKILTRFDELERRLDDIDRARVRGASA